MNHIPKLRRITDLTPGENALRKSARAELEFHATARESCTTCPKPVWFTAFFDGTGNNFAEDGDGSKVVPRVKYSNIAKLWRFAHPRAGELPPRTSFEYIEGVGTPCARVGDSGLGIDNMVGMSAAGKGEARIRWMLNALDVFVTSNMPFVSQINVAVFGFSRGATQARAFVRMLTETLAHSQGDELTWSKPGFDNKQPKVVVYFVGLLDTVSSVGFGGSRLEKSAPDIVTTVGTVLLPGGIVLGRVAGGVLRGINKGGHAAWAKDLRIPPYVRRCVHFVAGHEVREKFPSDSVREDQAVPGNCVELVYPGVHSDVGGGYEFRYQEERSNELSRVALNNMFIEAWKAGVPLKSPQEVMASAGGLFEISIDLESAWDVYMGNGVIGMDAPPAGRLENQLIWHMNRYYQWRASRRRRLRDGRLKPPGGVDRHMTITDREWSADIVDVAESRTGVFRSSVEPHQEAMFAAYKGTWLGTMAGEIRSAFDRFFDFYVHDSIAGFKKQMADGHVGAAEASRWSVNRQVFMGKRGEKYLYWRYEGPTPETAGTREARREQKNLPTESDVLVA
jgi:Uncharacterized alpha/beta hydrolase domain (DUF2235)